jgi:hypothetical protein
MVKLKGSNAPVVSTQRAFSARFLNQEGLHLTPPPRNRFGPASLA